MLRCCYLLQDPRKGRKRRRREKKEKSMERFHRSLSLTKKRGKRIKYFSLSVCRFRKKPRVGRRAHHYGGVCSVHKIQVRQRRPLRRCCRCRRRRGPRQLVRVVGATKRGMAAGYGSSLSAWGALGSRKIDGVSKRRRVVRGRRGHGRQRWARASPR